MAQTTLPVSKTNELLAKDSNVEIKAKELFQAILASKNLEHFSDDPSLNQGILAFFHTVLF